MRRTIELFKSDWIFKKLPSGIVWIILHSWEMREQKLFWISQEKVFIDLLAVLPTSIIKLPYDMINIEHSCKMTDLPAPQVGSTSLQQPSRKTAFQACWILPD